MNRWTEEEARLTSEEKVKFIRVCMKAYCGKSFTKRQSHILAFLVGMILEGDSLEVYVPEMRDFEQAGVSRTKIKEELIKLVKMKVILWNKREHLFMLNRKVSEWAAEPISCFDSNRYDQLIELNKYT